MGIVTAGNSILAWRFGRVPGGDRPQRVVYEITQKGREELHRLPEADAWGGAILDQNRLPMEAYSRFAKKYMSGTWPATPG